MDRREFAQSAASGGFRSNDQIDFTVEYLEQSENLIYRLSIIRLIKQSVQLRCRRSQPADDFALRQRTLRNALLCFERQPVQQKIPKVGGVLVVFEHLFDVDSP